MGCLLTTEILLLAKHLIADTLGRGRSPLSAFIFFTPESARVCSKLKVCLPKLQTLLLCLLVHLGLVSHIMFDKLFLSLRQKLRGFGPKVELLLFHLLQTLIFLKFFFRHLGETILSWLLQIRSTISCLVLRQIATETEFKVSSLEVSSGNIWGWFRLLLELKSNFTWCLLCVLFWLYFSFFTDVKVGFPAHLYHFSSFCRFLFKEVTVSSSFIQGLLNKILAITPLGHILIISENKVCLLNFKFLGNPPLLGNIDSFDLFHPQYLGFSLLRGAFNKLGVCRPRVL